MHSVIVVGSREKRNDLNRAVERSNEPGGEALQIPPLLNGVTSHCSRHSPRLGAFC